MKSTKIELEVSRREDLLLLVNDLSSQLKRKSAQLYDARTRLSRTRQELSKMRALVSLYRKQILEFYQNNA